VLGEAVTATVLSLDGVRWSGSVWATLAAAAAAVLCVWWITFDFVEVAVPSGSRGLAYLCAHLPVYGGIAALGIGIELALQDADAPHLPMQGRWIICGAGAAYLLGVTCVRAAADPHPVALAIHPIVGAALLVVAAVGTTLAGPVVLGILAVALVAELLLNTRLELHRSRG
jgi:low temperature requirement protein LtrA